MAPFDRSHTSSYSSHLGALQILLLLLLSSSHVGLTTVLTMAVCTAGHFTFRISPSLKKFYDPLYLVSEATIPKRKSLND